MAEPFMQRTTYRQYLLVLLMVILAFNFVDRLALGIVLQDIKIELNLTDTQLGFMTGIAFALFYSIMGIPIARWADRGDRVAIISLTAALWSVMVALCGMTVSFGQLLLVRVAVAVGEAGCIPPAYSLIADYFTRAERPRASAIYTLGGPLAFVIGYVLAGWLNERYGWRATFMILATPGVVLAALAWFTLKEPRRLKANPTLSELRPATRSVGAEAGWKDIYAILWANTTFRHLLFSYAVLFFFGYGITLWQPTFFIRSYGLKTGEVGLWFAVIYGLGGMIGTYLGGALATRYAANDERLQLKAIAIANIACGSLSFFAYLSTSKYLAFGLLAASSIGGFAMFGPLFATIQTLVPERMRAMSIAVLYLFANLIGMGLGPLTTGALSDAFHLWAGEESLRYSLLVLAPGYFWGAWHLWRASQTVDRDLVADGEGGHSEMAASRIALAD